MSSVTATPSLLPPASISDVVRRRAALVGSRLDPGALRGWVSPVEARLSMGIPYGDLAADERTYLEGNRRCLRSDLGVIARALLARALAPADRAVPIARPYIVSTRVDNLTISEALDRIFEERPRSSARVVHFVHAHALNIAAFDKPMQSMLARADLVLADGIGVRIAARILGVALRHNLNGTDLLPLLCRRAARKRIPLVLVGGEPGVAEDCARNLTGATRKLQIALVSHGFLDEQASREIVEKIRALGRCVVLVGMGSPVQEDWAWTHLNDLPEVTAITVGGLFDFFSERVPRAPLVWREMGLEWLYRWKQEPRRLAKRYLLGNPMFLSLALRQRLVRGRLQAAHEE